MASRKSKYWTDDVEIETPPQEEFCPLCDRLMESADADRHHLIPRHKGGDKGPTVMIHRFCHTKIHSLFTNSELARSYSTIEALRAHPEVARFIEWVQGKPSSFYMKNTSTNAKKRR